MKPKRIEITEDWHETFRIRGREPATIILGIIGVPLAFLLLLCVGLLCMSGVGLHASDWLFDVPFFFFSSTMILGVMVVVWKTRVDISQEGISYTVFRERFVAWREVVGVRHVFYNELWIFVSRGSPVRIGSLEGRGRIEQLVETMSSIPPGADLLGIAVRPAVRTARVVFSLIVVGAVLALITLLVSAVGREALS